ncbi:MAG TPA: ribonuclease H [Myxococcaceae bacterium]|nr:ribonuclease H [Myxococcaceae bacterium]
MSDATARFVVFADGSSLTNPGGPGGTGFIAFDRERSALRFGGVRYEVDGEFAVTNNRMELRAVLQGLEGIPDGATVEVTSDSLYVVKALSLWIHGWRRKGWRTADGSPVLNRDLIETIDARGGHLHIRDGWVRGHDGHPLNELVDALAQSAARGVTGPTREEILPALRQLLGVQASAHSRDGEDVSRGAEK